MIKEFFFASSYEYTTTHSMFCARSFTRDFDHRGHF
jgi:hypothetical protein